ncbi:MAG: DMT family transporter [Thermoplasmata archaeon]
MVPGSRGRSIAIVLATLAAFLWSTYYVFVLWLAPSTAPSAVLIWPFVVGGGLFALYAVANGHGAAFCKLWADPAAWLRILFAVGMQISTLAATYTAGPIDTSLLALIGDVVVAPLVLTVLYLEGRDRLRSREFIAGLSLSVVGGALTIVGGHAIAPITGWAVLVIPVLPITVAMYFVMTARAARTVPISALNAQAFLGAGIVLLFLAPLLPGGTAGLFVLDPTTTGLLVVLGAITFFVAPLCYFLAVEKAGLILTALLMASIPVFTLALSVGVLGIVPTLLGALGVPVALLGAIFAIQGNHPPWTPDYTPGGGTGAG